MPRRRNPIDPGKGSRRAPFAVFVQTAGEEPKQVSKNLSTRIPRARHRARWKQWPEGAYLARISSPSSPRWSIKQDTSSQSTPKHKRLLRIDAPSGDVITTPVNWD